MMKISRRDFVHSSCAAGALSLFPSPLMARLPRGGPGGSQVQGKAQVNVNQSGNASDFPFINAMKFADALSPTGGTPTADPWALLNSDGYPTAICSGTAGWRSNNLAYYPGGESYFTGSVSGTVLTVTGSVTGAPLFIGQSVSQVSGTAVTLPSRITSFGTGSGGAGTYNLSASSSATGSISIEGFIPWVLDWVGSAGVSGSMSSNGLVFPPPGYAVGSNRIEFILARLNQGAGATFTVNLTAGSVSATMTSITGTLFEGMKISGVGIPPYTVLGPGSGSSWVIIFETNGSSGGGVLSYNLTNVAAIGAPLAFGDSVQFSLQITSITTTPSNIRLYRQDEEALLNAGQLCAPHFIGFYKQYGRLRFMNWLTTNGSFLANWADRCPQTYFTWSGIDNFLFSKYSGRCPATGSNAFTGPNALPGNPSSWADKTSVQFSVSNCPAVTNFIATIDNGSGSAGNTLTVSSTISGAIRIGLRIYVVGAANNQPQECVITAGSGTSWTVNGAAQLIPSQQMMAYAVVTGFSNANPAVVTSANHGLTTGNRVSFPGNSFNIIGGSIFNNLNGPGGASGTDWSNSYQITVIDSSHFSLNGVDSTTWGTYSSGGVFLLSPTFQCGSLPAKLIATASVNQFGIEGGGYQLFQSIFNNQVPVVLTGVYDSALDVIMVALQQSSQMGMSYEGAIQIANELNVDPWINVPALATDDFVLQLSTYMKANLRSGRKWCFELANEVWNPGVGFWQTYYASAVATTKWPATVTDGSQVDQWYGWRFFNMMTQVNSIYTGNSQVQRIFGFRVDGAPHATQRATAPATGVASDPLRLADSLCFADYISLQSVNQALPQAQDIYNYQQGILTANPSLVTSALNGMDAAFNAFGCGPLFSPITCSIDNGSGSAGTTLTVTAISTAGPPVPQNPRLGPQTVLSAFGGSTPTVATYIVQQLSIQAGHPANTLGTYQVSQSQLLPPGSTLTATGGTFDSLLNTFIPFYIALAATYSVPEVCFYEGGYGDLPGFESQYTSYLGNPINLQDLFNLEVAYQASSQYATSYGNYLSSVRAAGAKFSSAYCATAAGPNVGGMYGMAYNIFGTPQPAKAAFDTYNAT